MNVVEKAARIYIHQDEKAFISTCVNEYLLDTNNINTRSATDRLNSMIKLADVTDDMITYVRNKFLAHYSKDVHRATHLCTTLKNRIIEYTTNIDKGINDVPIRSRSKKPETDDARNERLTKETAVQLALDYDAKIQKDIDELNELRDDMINGSKILLREAERLVATDVIFESDYSAFEISYEGLEAMRVKLLPHINANEDCRSTYVTVLDISSNIYNKGYNARFNWALDLKDEKEKIRNRKEEINFVSVGQKRLLQDTVNCNNSEFEEKMKAISTLKHIEKNKISSTVKQLTDKGILLLNHIQKYFKHKQEQELVHAERVIEADSVKNKSARRTITSIVDNTLLTEVNDNTKGLIALEQSKIIAALKIIETSTNEIKRLDPSLKRYSHTFYSIYSDPSIPKKAPNAIFLETTKISTSKTYEEYLKKLFELLFGCDESKEVLNQKKFRHKQTNDII